MFAPVKTIARMANKLFNDHAKKPTPRPQFNVDTVRAGVSVHVVELMEPVYNAIDREVRPPYSDLPPFCPRLSLLTLCPPRASTLASIL